MIWVYLALLALGFFAFAIFLVASIAISERDGADLVDRYRDVWGIANDTIRKVEK